MNSMMKEMDVKALIEQIETKEEDFILTALETYNKEVTVTRELFHKVFFIAFLSQHNGLLFRNQSSVMPI